MSFVGCIAVLLTCWMFPTSLRVRLRKKVVCGLYGFPVRRKAAKVGVGLRVKGPTRVNRKTELGDHFHTNGMTVYGSGRVTIGRYFHSGWNLRIFTRSHDYNGSEAIPYSGGRYVVKSVEVGDFVWIGADVILLPGTKIGEGAIIQAGSVVHGEIPPLAIAGGNPAKVFAQRDADHFNRLKAEGRFY